MDFSMRYFTVPESFMLWFTILHNNSGNSIRIAAFQVGKTLTNPVRSANSYKKPNAGLPVKDDKLINQQNHFMNIA